MVEERAQLVDLWCTRTNFILRARNVFAVLPASRVGTVRGSDEGERSANAVPLHLLQSFGQHGMPIAIAPVDRDLGSMLRQFAFESCNQFTGLLVDRTLAAEMVVMFGDRQHALPRNIPPAQNVFQERNHILRALGPAEGDNQNRVVIHSSRLPLNNQMDVAASRYLPPAATPDGSVFSTAFNDSDRSSDISISVNRGMMTSRP